MPTLAAIRQRILQTEPALGRVEAIGSLTGSSATVASLAVGTIAPGKFSEVWLLRPDASLADRLRFTTGDGYDSTTGALTHAGAAYSDLAAAGELVEIHEHEPYRIDIAIQDALRTVRRVDRSMVPTRRDGRYHLHALDWIEEPADILRVGPSTLRTLTPNRHFEKWAGYDQDGALVPDRWTLGNESGSTYARSTDTRRGPYALSVGRSGTTATVSFPVGLLEDGVSADTLRGERVTAAAIVRCSQAASARITVDDGVGSTTSNIHSGGGEWEELTAAHTIDHAATMLTLTLQVTKNGTALVDELYCVAGPLNDTERRDAGHILWNPEPKYEQNPLVYLGTRRPAGALIVESQRPYPTFDAARLREGTADDDISDAPVDLIARQSLWKFYENVAASASGTDNDGALARRWGRAAGQARAGHFYQEDTVDQGLQIVGNTTFGRRAR